MKHTNDREKEMEDLLEKYRGEMIEKIMAVEYRNLGLGRLNKDEKLGVDGLKMYLKHKLKSNNL